MTRIDIPGKPIVEVTVKHDPPNVKERSTRVTVKFSNGNEITTISTCGPRDQFSRARGRKIAANRMMAELRDFGVPIEMRRSIFDEICPEFRKADPVVSVS